MDITAVQTDKYREGDLYVYVHDLLLEGAVIKTIRVTISASLDETTISEFLESYITAECEKARRELENA